MPVSPAYWKRKRRQRGGKGSRGGGVEGGEGGGERRRNIRGKMKVGQKEEEKD